MLNRLGFGTGADVVLLQLMALKDVHLSGIP